MIQDVYYRYSQQLPIDFLVNSVLTSILAKKIIDFIYSYKLNNLVFKR